MKKSLFQVDDTKKIRVIIDSDANCEADDQYAIMHALMSEKVDVVGIIAEHYGSRDENSMMRSYEEIKKILELAHDEHTPLLRGEPCAISDSYDSEQMSEGADFIIQEAKKEDMRPLVIISQGALSTVAAALLKDSIVAEKAVCLSVGGCAYPKGGMEFNYVNDCRAADIVMKSAMEVWQFPEEVYSQMQVGIFELYDKVACCGELGKYLYEHLLDVQKHMTGVVPKLPFLSDLDNCVKFPNGESWSMGDSCAIGALLAANVGEYTLEDAPVIAPVGTYSFSEKRKKIRIYHSINSRFILEDFFAKLKYHFG